MVIKLSANEFLENFVQELVKNKWDAEEIKCNINVEGTKFDLFAAKKSVQYWRAYVMTSPQFIDEPTFQEYIKIYDVLRDKAQSWAMGDVSILCIVAESGVSPDITPKVGDYSLGFFQMKSGGCMLCIVDLAKRATYMRTPGLPLPVRRISRGFVDIVKHTLAKLK